MMNELFANIVDIPLRHLIGVVVIVLATIPATLVSHEFGHFLAARWLSLRVIFFHAGPLWIDYAFVRPRITFHLRSWLSGGVVKVILPTTLGWKQRLLFFGSGILSNFFVALIQATVATWLLSRNVIHAGLFFVLQAVGAFVCLLLAALPMRVQPWSPFPSDGYRVIQLLRFKGEVR